jgi:hypothetical protein
MGGSCKFNCQPNFGHCQTFGSNTNTGCETNLTTNVDNCASCGRGCDEVVKNTTGRSCVASSCKYTACRAGYGDCNGNPADGCECACGTVGIICCPGNVCGVGLSCVAGKCQ